MSFCDIVQLNVWKIIGLKLNFYFTSYTTNSYQYSVDPRRPLK